MFSIQVTLLELTLMFKHILSSHRLHLRMTTMCLTKWYNNG